MKKLVRHIFPGYSCFSILLICSVELSAQPAGLKIYNLNDGLPSTEIFGACQDKYGYLWINTSAGLSRFDGRQFVNYSLTDGLPSLKGTGIFHDSQERLWVSTYAGAAQFKNNRFITYPTSDNLDIFYVFNIIETKEKQIWALTDKGAYEFADSVWKKLSLYPGFENISCRGAIEINQELYINYPDDLVCRTKEGKWLHIASTPNGGSLFNLMTVRNYEIWISTANNIYRIRDHQLIPLFKNNIPVKNYLGYFVDSKKRLWLTEGNSLQISKPDDWQHFSASEINPQGNIATIQEDSSHNTWISTSEGLMKIKDIAFTIIDKNNTSPLDGIYNIIALPDNRLLLSSGTKTGLLAYDNNKCTQIMPPQSPGNKNYYKDPVDAYTFDGDGNLWMVTRFRKFLQFNGKSLKDFSGALHLKTHENIYDMDFSKRRNQFFICADSTLLYGNSTNFSTFIPNNTGVPIVKPTRIHETKNGLLLLYIDRQGVYVIDTANKLISLTRETGIDGRKKGIQLGVSFYEDTNNNFWIAFPGEGLYEYGFAKNKMPFLKNHFTIQNGLQSNNVLSLTNDRQNRLWVATTTGLDILEMKKDGSGEVFNYARADELTINRSDYKRLVTDTAGNVWLSSPNRIVKFKPGDIRLHKETPRIIIENVSLAFKVTDWSKLTDSLYGYYQLPYNPVLNYNQNSLGISFNAIDFSTSNSDPEYSYKLLPLDTTWSIPSKTRSVSFAQLPPGSYKFIVRAKDQASGWSQPAEFLFTITVPFWDKWWFRLTIIAIVSSIIISIFRVRIRKIRNDAFIEKKVRELEMKALKLQMNPHFIYNALNSIQALVANNKKKESIHYIGSFSRLLRQVLAHSENNVISLDSELETIGLYIQLETLRLDMKLHYEKSISQDIVIEFEKIPPLILQPFVENALWHGLSRKEGEKEIKMAVSVQDDWLVCDITDNGIGREKAQEWKTGSAVLHQSKGIEITRRRLLDYNEDDSVSPIEFFDLFDDKQNPSGTHVAIRIKRKYSLPSS